MKKYCLALDLVNDEKLIREYERLHQKENHRPEIMQSIREAGIITMEIYRIGNRLFMIMETNDDFNFSEKAALDKSNIKVQEWEALTWTFQQSLPWSKEGEKWVLMNKIFEL